MILAVTLNPAVDKLYVVKSLNPNSVMRVQQVNCTAGGKGMNVARVAAIGGYKSVAMGFLGGKQGEFFESLITEPNIEKAFTQTENSTRSCVNVWDELADKSTEFLEPGPAVSSEECARFLSEYEQKLKEVNVVAICGSLPQGVPTDIYGKMIELAKKHGKKVILDTSGDALCSAVNSKPTLVKPNEDEIRQILNVDINDRQELIDAAKKLHKLDIEVVAVSLGKDGVLVVCESGVYRGVTPDIPVVNTVGCGDSMVAGFAVGMAEGWDIEKTITYAVAVSTANAMNKKTGFYDKADYDAVLPQIYVEKLD